MSTVAFGARRLCFLVLLVLLMALGGRQEAYYRFSVQNEEASRWTID